MPEFSPIFGSLFQYFDSLALVQVAFAGLIFYSAVSFLRLRPWARIAIEAVAWSALVGVVGFRVFMVLTFLGAVPAERPPGPHIPPGTFRALEAVMGTVVAAVFAVLLALLLTFVRGAPVKTAFRQREHGGA